MDFYKTKKTKKGLRYIAFYFLIIILLLSLLSCSTFSIKKESTKQSTETTEKQKTTESQQIESNSENIIDIPAMGANDSFYVNENNVYDLSYDGSKASIQAFDIFNGKKLWNYQDEWEKGGKILGADSELLYITREDNRLYAFDVNNGKLKWKFMYPEDFNKIYKIINSKDKDIAYFIAGSGENFEIFSINKQDGSILWSNPDVGARQAFVSETGKTLIIEKGDLYNRGNYIGVDPENGKIKYETKLRSCYYQNILPGNTFIASDAEHAHGLAYEMAPIVLFNLDSGQLIWETAESDICDPAYVSPNCIYVGTGAGIAQLLVFDLQSGKKLWNDTNFSYSSNVYGENKLLGEFNGIVIMSNPTKSFTWIIDPNSGNVIWENDELVLDEIIGISNNLIIGLDSKNFLCGIDLNTGDKKWKLDLSQELLKSIVLHSSGDIYRGILSTSGKSYKGIIKNNKIILFSEQGLIVIDPSNGSKIENISVPNINYSSDFYLQEDLLIIRSDFGVSIIKI